MRLRPPIVMLLLLPLVQVVAQESAASAGRCRALSQLADRAGFDAAAAVAALADSDEHVARTAAAIVRHEWVELPEALFLSLAGEPRAAYRLLDEFARAPRPAAVAWVDRQCQAAEQRSLDHRLLAMAARAQPLAAVEARLLIDALIEGEGGDGFHLVLPFVSEKVADGLIGRLHQGLMQQQFAVERVAYLLDRLSPRGVESLLGLASTLPVATARVLCRHVHQNRPELVRRRVASLLDGTAPLQALWLEFAGPLLDRPERVQRVLAVLKHGASFEEREAAFGALLDAEIVDERMLAIAVTGDVDGGVGARIRRLLSRAVDHVPPARLATWLRDLSPEIGAATAKALTRRTDLPPLVQRALLAMVHDAEVVDGAAALDALTAIVQQGDAKALTEIWPKMMQSRSWSLLLDRLGHRREPFVHELLLAELIKDKGAVAGTDPRERQRQLDLVRLLLVGRGDRRELETLVEHAPMADATFVRRCRHHARPLPEPFVEPLLQAALSTEDIDRAAELLEWVATNEHSAPDRLFALWSDPPEVPAQAELREIALRVTAMGSRRQLLVQAYLHAVAAGPLPESMTSLPYELLNSMREPMSIEDARLCARILLLPPLSDPEGERRQTERWPDGTFGFPLATAVAARVRGADAGTALAGFDSVVRDLVQDPRSAAISHQRLKVFWRSLAMAPELMRQIGAVTAQLWRLGDHGVGDGAALWLTALAAERDRDHERAESLYRRALVSLLRLPDARQEARWLLGDRDPVAGRDAWAALSAAPYRMRYEAAKAAGKPDAMAIAARLVREFAGHDHDTLATLNHPQPESGR